ncbi:MAG: hypothetical protein ACJ8AI_18605 [Rhodopila sp.]|jgi:hypothetical protein
MKRSVCLLGLGLLGLGLCCMATSAMADSAINTIIAVANPRNYEDRCPTTITFVGTISVNQPTKVMYRWERSDRVIGRTETAVIQGRGQSVSTSWQLSRPKGATFKGAETLHVLSPADQVSNPAEFTLTCR